jgi:hypothetical protein
MKIKIWAFCVIAMMFAPLVILAHAPNQSYIFLRIYEKDGIEGRFEINLRELNKVFGLNLKNGSTEEDLSAYLQEIRSYLANHSAFSSRLGEHKIRFRDIGIFHSNLGDFLQVYFELENTDTLPTELEVSYTAVFEEDSTHRAFLVVEYNWRAGVINNEANISLYFQPEETTDTLSLKDFSVWKGFKTMVKQGIWHIWIGLDHILFLIALILPSVVRRSATTNPGEQPLALNPGNRNWGWKPVLRFKPAFIYIITVITFFTIAHTITLTLASLQLITLPSRLVESVIALSIGLAAFHNIRPIFKGRDWIIAFVFGLFHGFGFATVLRDLGLTAEFLSFSLLGFNIGVEIGQVFIIALVFPLLYLFRKSEFYPKVLVYGSALLIFASVYWCIERGFDINLGMEDYLRSVAYKIAVSLGLR